ncbi:MAG: uncharacterized protein A8A55_2571 [Amphiamblys sp. WSBS2006]|nr:MAG: uncharacterized protein A8A55_2571 [Amphiamblys sp. WSBS2006]
MISQRAEDVPGKRGIVVAVRSGLSVKEIGKQEPHFCIAEIEGLCGKLVAGSVYIPCNEQTATMETLGKAIGKLAERKSQILLGGDWNMKRATLLREVRKWHLDARIVESRGSPETRHGNSRRREDWSTLDYFVVVGPLLCSGTSTDRRHFSSDHWPIWSRTRPTREGEGAKKTLSRMALRKRGNEIANMPSWEKSHQTVEGLLKNTRSIADRMCLWNKTRNSKRLPLSRGTIRALGQLRKLKRKAVLGRELSREEIQTAEELKKVVKKRCKEEIRARFRNWQRKIAADVEAGDLSAAWRLAKPSQKRRAGLGAIVDEEGVLQTAEEDIDRTWAAYWAGLYKDKDGHSRNRALWEEVKLKVTPIAREELDAEIVEWELIEGLGKLENWKAAGPDGIPPEFYKTAAPGTHLFNAVLKLFREIWATGQIPREWEIAEVVPIPKKGDVKNPENYRGISLIPVGLKILNGIIARRLGRAMEKHGILRKEQAGFRKGEECAAQAAALVETVGRRRKEKAETHLCFIDFKKAFDRVPHEALLKKAIAGLGLDRDGVFGRYLESLYRAPTARIRGGKTEWDCEVGVRQGCPLSPILFILFINDILDDTGCLGVTIPGKKEKIGGLLFADDVVLLGESAQGIRDLLEKVVTWTERWRMEINPAKCGVISPDGTPVTCLEVQGERIPDVEFYSYLGIKIGKSDQRAVRRNADRIKGNSVLHENSRTLTNPCIPLLHKTLLLRGVVLPSMLYGKEVGGNTHADLKECTRVLNRALVMVVGRGVSLAAARRVLGIPTLRALVGKSQCRALREFPKKKTVIGSLLETSPKGKETWWNCTQRGVKRLLKGTDWRLVTPRDASDLIWKSEETLDRSKGLERLRTLVLHPEECSIVRLSGTHPEWGLGWGMVLRLMCGHLWTGPRLAKAKLKESILTEECPGCKGAAEDEIHWVFHCPAWEDGRLIADKEAGLATGERANWAPSYPIDIVCGAMSLEERTKRYKWLAVFFTATASKRRAILGGFDLPGRTLGRPFRDRVSA